MKQPKLLDGRSSRGGIGGEGSASEQAGNEGSDQFVHSTSLQGHVHIQGLDASSEILTNLPGVLSFMAAVPDRLTRCWKIFRTPPLPRGQISQRPVSYRKANQPQRWMTDVRGHAPNLTVLALAKSDFEP